VLSFPIKAGRQKTGKRGEKCKEKEKAKMGTSKKMREAPFGLPLSWQKKKEVETMAPKGQAHNI